ncbi:MAG: 16S rRNA (guanine(966)-N(2))-methyltransferase RsmD [Gammaproteobacteria bacterium]|nr:16S rRNA (guanine(966)-N(2))-methyltransferase RsmD [Gammaproteobacteria bacterium]MCP4091707.1 16S rRNA (guanine(966)-N(2))-methyltransferase RsmD [Gammaproteobacteria bacterium]MCP4275014.1 16S rRNA (guanine(966)-N(2))-methyltransferase RsmD [Gammaproteobacteria bacterium]MCP4831837.1 16S rRNA (guanine(966)-N(2))-methyltransferase RsmD [Gammaproteobacteria bacterium]MCP4929773.1 16S rRNA (guanine(966)-N(2))-methyltransferase RsmD [Gammaproteobacteria bacterium]
MLSFVYDSISDGRIVAKSEHSSVRIIAGCWKGRRIHFATKGIRPTADRVRETLFNWLQPSISDACCLDMFAGTGALGLEALSRGAVKTVFIEQNRQAVSQLKKNIEVLGVKEAGSRSAKVIKADAFTLSYADRGPFDIVFIDPPFVSLGTGPILSNLCTLLESAGCLSPDAYIYIEMAKQVELPSLPEIWSIVRERTAGNVRYMLVQRKPRHKSI